MLCGFGKRKGERLSGFSENQHYFDVGGKVFTVRMMRRAFERIKFHRIRVMRRPLAGPLIIRPGGTMPQQDFSNVAAFQFKLQAMDGPHEFI